MFDPTPQGAVLTDACRRDLYVFNRVLSKPNVFRLIAGSTLPEAVRFEEVLTSVRKTGGYSVRQPSVAELAVVCYFLLCPTCPRLGCVLLFQVDAWWWGLGASGKTSPYPRSG
jgi:hypothetical protein